MIKPKWPKRPEGYCIRSPKLSPKNHCCYLLMIADVHAFVGHREIATIATCGLIPRIMGGLLALETPDNLDRPLRCMEEIQYPVAHPT
jgi:hypothetical protein